MANHYTIVQGGAVVTVFGGPQNPVGLPGYTVITSDTDPLWVAWLASQSAASTEATITAAYSNIRTAGLEVTWTTSSLNGTYGTTTADQLNLNSWMLLAGTNDFPGFYYDDDAVRHTITAAQFQALYNAVTTYIANVIDVYQKRLAGTSPPWPTATASINL